MQKKIKILLIEPSEPWITNNKRLKPFEQVVLPIGLMYISSYLKETFKAAVDIKILSTIIDLTKIEDLQGILKQFLPDIIGIRNVILYNSVVNEIINVSKKHLPSTLIVLGGPNVSVHNEFLYNDNVDILIEGEGEETFREIVGCLMEYGRIYLLNHLNKIKGIFFRKNAKIVKTKERELIKNIDKLPIPDYSSVDLNKYCNFLNFGYNRRKMGVLFTSRGCPYKCIYCHDTFGKKFRPRSIDNIHKEVIHLTKNYGIKDFCIVDDNFNFNSNRVVKLADRLIKYGPKINLYFPNGLRGDLLSFELIDKLIMAGTIYISFSLETASNRLQKLIKKNININKLKEIVQYSCDRNIITHLVLMVGFPTETLEEAKYSLSYFSQFKKIVLPYYFSLKYYPNTELYSISHKYGIRLNKNTSQSPYHGYEFQETPLISYEEFEGLNYWYLKNIFLNMERLTNAISILSKHFSKKEICDMFSLFFRKEIKDIEIDILKTHEVLNR